MNKLIQYQQKAEKELIENILPFWIEHTIDPLHGGFYGFVSDELEIQKDAPKAVILCTRILWTFSTAYRLYQKNEYKTMANIAYEALIKNFLDRGHGGLYWMLDCEGNPISDRKQIYAQAFGIYALTEYSYAMNHQETLLYAIELFSLIEKYSYDPKYQGYYEAFTREWQLEEDLRLSERDMNVKKSMNTHLHMLEAYTHLYRVTKDDTVKGRLEELIEVTIERIIDVPSGHFKLYLDEDWVNRNDHISFGHDIEGSWLLYEAAEVLGDEEITAKVKAIALKMAEVTLKEGVDIDGGLLYEANAKGIIDSDKHWWPQAEACVGFLNAFQLCGEEKYLDAFYDSWGFIEQKMIDRVHGEWFSRVTRGGTVVPNLAKADNWKCPYHNGRACFEIAMRIKNLLKMEHAYE